jgi:hypothetical protein
MGPASQAGIFYWSRYFRLVLSPCLGRNDVARPDGRSGLTVRHSSSGTAQVIRKWLLVAVGRQARSLVAVLEKRKLIGACAHHDYVNR